MSGSRACFRAGTDSSSESVESAPRIRSADIKSRRAGSVKPARPSSPIPRITSFDRASLNVAVLFFQP